VECRISATATAAAAAAAAAALNPAIAAGDIK
jgi:hypothetical protein